MIIAEISNSPQGMQLSGPVIWCQQGAQGRHYPTCHCHISEYTCTSKSVHRVEGNYFLLVPSFAKDAKTSATFAPRSGWASRAPSRALQSALLPPEKKHSNVVQWTCLNMGLATKTVINTMAWWIDLHSWSNSSFSVLSTVSLSSDDNKAAI